MSGSHNYKRDAPLSSSKNTEYLFLKDVPATEEHFCLEFS
jgi:hypothetical protein